MFDSFKGKLVFKQKNKIYLENDFGLREIYVENKIKVPISKAVVRLPAPHSEQNFSLEIRVGPGQNRIQVILISTTQF